MKFNAIVGNPPYQVMDGGIGSSAVPVYHHFVNVANRIDPQYVSLIMPAKWYSGGRGLDSFRQSMLSDRSISHLFDFIDSHDCFTKVDIAGGVCYFLRDKFYNGNCVVSTIRNGKTTVVTRNLNELDVFVRTKEELDILDKIKSNTESFMSDVVLAQKPFGLRTYETPLSEGDIVLRYNKGKGLYLRKRIETNSNLIDKWKVITSCATNEHAGETDKNGRKRIISTLEVLKPGEICTETYMVISTFESEKEANSCIAYIKTNLVRFMLAMVTTTQHLSKSNFQFVPLQDFSEPWTDEKLYAKYGITPDEQAYIESLIKPME